MDGIAGLGAWASGNFEEFGKLISASGLSSIENYECGMCVCCGCLTCMLCRSVSKNII